MFLSDRPRAVMWTGTSFPANVAALVEFCDFVRFFVEWIITWFKVKCWEWKDCLIERKMLRKSGYVKREHVRYQKQTLRIFFWRQSCNLWHVRRHCFTQLKVPCTWKCIWINRRFLSKLTPQKAIINLVVHVLRHAGIHVR